MSMNKPLIDDFGFAATEDLANMVLGKYLGSGSFRDVYELRFNLDLVVKVEKGKTFYNVAEWEIWSECPAEYAKWLAPCLHISDCGRCLVQRRVEPSKSRPRKIPNWMDDNKLANWGKYKGRLVCCDYGHHRFFKDGFRRQKLVAGSDMWRTPIRSV